MNPTDPEHAALLIEALLRQVIADKLSLDPLSIGRREALFSLGVTSLISEEIRAELDRHFDGLSSTILFEQPNIERLCGYLSQREVARALDEQMLQPLVAQLAARAAALASEVPAEAGELGHAERCVAMPAGEAVAVIGISARVPGAATPQAFWRNLVDRIDSVGEVPPHRWDAKTLYDRRQDREGIRSKWGGFIEGIEYFDPLFFRVSHKEAEQMDPQQKLFLQCAWEVMEDAGYGNPERRPTRQVGVFVGVTWNEFSLVAQDAKTQQGGGSLYWGIPNRVSYCLDLTGPSQSVDTACSSSLVAIHNACASVLSGESSMAIAGGVNLNLHPAKYRFLSQNHFLSSEGKCRSFGEGGDGYVPGEGVVALLLKPLTRALADGDHVYGVIRGSATNHGGKVTGYTVPNPDAHADLVRTALQRAALAPQQIDYIECHGTGTELGDPIEIRGLSGAFGERVEGQACWVGSVKSNLGHLEAAAGAAGVVKVLLSMQHGLLPAGLHAETVNRKIDFQRTPFALLQSHQAWPVREGRGTRVAGVSSFGAGGTNAHLVLESPVARQPEADPHSACWIALSAQSEAQLRDQARQLGGFLRDVVLSEAWADGNRPAWSLPSVAYTLSHGRQHFAHRLLTQVDSLSELSQRLLEGASAPDWTDSLLVGVAGAAGQPPVGAHGPAWAWVTGASDEVPDAAGLRPCRVPLPTYPFLRERCWPTEGPTLVSEGWPLGREDGAGVLHPLLDANVSTLRKQQFRKRLRQSDYYLRDHLVAHEHVVPGVCHLELAMAAAGLALEGGPVLLREVWFTNVIAVRQATRDVSITLQPRESWVEFAIDADDDGTPFSRGRLVHQPADGQPRRVDLQALSSALTQEWDVDAVYRRFGRSGVIQKQAFQVLRRIQFSEPARGQALARLSLDASLRGDFDRYLLHPTLMDGAVQTAMMLLQFCLDRELPILPIHFGSVRLLAPLQQEVLVHCQLRHVEGKRFDLDITDPQGQVLVEIRDFILKEMKDGKPSTEARLDGPAVRLASRPAEVPAYVPCWRDEPLVGPATGMDQLLVLGGEDADLAWLQGCAELAGARLQWAQWHPQGLERRQDRWLVNPDDPQALASLLAQAGAEGGVSRLLVLSADDGPQSLARPGRTVFLLTQALLSSTRQLHMVVHCSGQRPEDLALGGFFRTLRVERPSFVASVVQSGRSALDQALASALCRELVGSGGGADLRLTDGRRQTLGWLPQPVPAMAANDGFQPGGVYLVTGGLGGLGRIVAAHLSQSLQACVYLVGRSELDGDKLLQLQALQALGGQVRYLRCDIADQAAVHAAVAHIQAEAGRLDGVLHAAGVVEDAFILKKSLASFDRTLAPKVQGTRHLDIATAHLPLSMFVVFSSVTAILGNVGQCDYGLGNAFADHFCRQRAEAVRAGRRSGRSLSINWPFWADGGMRLTEREQQALAKGFGIHPLSTADGLQALAKALAGDEAQVAVLKGDAQRIAEVLGLQTGVVDTWARTSASVPPASGSPSMAAAQDLPQRIEAYLKELLATHLKIPRERLKADERFDQYGLDSIAMIELISAMDGRFDNLPKTLFFEYQSIAELVSYLAAHHAAAFAAEAPDTASSGQPGPEAAVGGTRFLDATLAAQGSTVASWDRDGASLGNEAIAIIGLAGRYPEASTLDAFWRNLCEGRDCIETIPAERWSVDAHWQAADGIKSTGDGKSYARWGSFLRDVDCFDAAYFNITPKEAAVLDPQERLFLECVNAAIEDAGYRPDRLDARAAGRDNRVGVYAGTMWSEYQLFGQDEGDRFSATPQSFAWSLANRVSYFFNFNGPSLTVDTACSSSFSALNLACEALRRGEVTVAIAGAVNLSLHPKKYALLSRMKFLSTDGRCRSFGQGGDGYVPGEGLGAVVLKPLSAALRDRDHIHGVIRSSVLNHGGRTSGFTVPNPVAQARLIGRAIEEAGLSPADLDYIEAHGTGTDLGDPVEMAGLGRVFAGVSPQTVPIGSVKSNYGHLEAAAGMIALTKVLLQLRHGTLVPSIHSEPLNPKIGFESSPFRVQQRCEPWAPRRAADGQRLPRRAGISSFGAGGSNAHLVVEEAPAVPPLAADPRPQLMMYSARRPQDLQALLQRHAEFLADRLSAGQAPELADMAFTLCTGRVPLACRVAFVASDLAGLLVRLQALAKDLQQPGVASSQDAQSQTAATLADDGSLLQRWSAQRQLERLALVWAGGLDLDDSLLFDAASRRRVPLPGYVHDRQRHWVALDVKAAPSTPRLHAWLDENVSTLSQHVFRKTFDSQNVWLDEHRVHGRATVPAVVMLEMARAAVQQAAQQPVAWLGDLRWLSPVQPGEVALSLRVRLLPQGEQGWFELASDAQGRHHVHAYGRYALTSSLPTAPDRVDLDALRQGMQPTDLPASEEALGGLGLGLGRNYRVTQACWRSADAVLVALNLDAAATPTGDLPHPGLLDGALRASLSVAPGPLRVLRVPVALAQYQVHGPVGSRCLAWAREVQRDGQPVYDIRLLDEQGYCMVAFAGLQLQAIASVASQAAPAAVTAPARPAEAGPETAAVALLQRSIAAVTRLSPDQVPLTQAFPEMGIDSLMVMELNEKLESALGPLSKTLFYEHAHVQDLARTLAQDHGPALRALSERTDQGGVNSTVPVSAPQADSAGTDAPEALVPPGAPTSLPYAALLHSGAGHASQEPIAVIGFAGSFPQAADAEAFWQHLRDGVDCIEEVPPARWNHAALHVPGTAEPGKVSAKWGGFMPDVDCFDAGFFQIPPVMARQIDPQERLFLQTAWSAMESAGYTPAAMEDARTRLREVGVFVGFMWSHYGVIEAEEHLKGQPAVGITWNSSIANRVSHFCDFKGPSFVVDVACASSLMAVHLAVESLRRGECRYAIAGGVNLTLHPSKYRTLTQMGMLASDGRCRSFGAGGSGYVPGEGVGALLLKPLSQAEQDGDTVYMTILGTAVNHGGRSNGYTVPNPDAQARCIEKALEQARVEAREISYVEAHGTGTVLGDPIEVSGLGKAFRKQTGDRGFCAIGSVKSNIGHLESAAGMASMIKVLQQMRHGELVPSLHTANLNPNIDFDASPFQVQRERQAWQRPVLATATGRWEVPRTALVNAFAAGGTNTILVVREPAARPAPAGGQNPVTERQLIVLSAKRKDSLLAQLGRLRQHLEREAPPLADLAYTLQVGREAMAHRLAWVVTNLDELRQCLVQAEQAGHGEVAPAQPVRQGEAVHAAILAGDLDQLAALWLGGQAVPWADLHRGQTRRRIALPTYAFARERHWLAIQGGQPGALCAPVLGPGTQAPHPLLDRNVSSFGGLGFSKWLRDEDGAPLLPQQDGRGQWPAAAGLEMMRAGGQLAGHLPVAGLRSLRFTGEAALSGQELRLGLRQEPGRTLARITRLDGASDESTLQGETLLAEAALVFGPSALPALRLDVDAVRARCSQDMPPAQVNTLLEAHGLSLATVAPWLEQVRLRRGEMIARLRLPVQGAAWAAESGGMSPWMAEWCWLGAWVLMRQDGQRVEPALRAVDQVQFGARPQGACWLHIRWDEDRRASVDVYDDTQLLCQRWQGLSLGGPAPDTANGSGRGAAGQEGRRPTRAEASPALAQPATLACQQAAADASPKGGAEVVDEALGVLGFGHAGGGDGALDLTRLDLAPDDARRLSLSQRQWLEAVAQAMAEAVCSRDTWRRSRTAVFVASNGDEGALAQLARGWLGGQGRTVTLQADDVAGWTALEVGAKTLAAGVVDLAIVGQVDAHGAWALMLSAAQAATPWLRPWARLSLDATPSKPSGPALNQHGPGALLPGLQAAWAAVVAAQDDIGRAGGVAGRAEWLNLQSPEGGSLRLWAPTVAPVSMVQTSPCLFPLAAADQAALRTMASDLAALLTRDLEQGRAEAAGLQALALSLQVGRDALHERVLFQAEDAVELLQRLQRFLAGEADALTWRSTSPQGELGLAAEIFDGPLGTDLLAALHDRGDHDSIARLWALGWRLDWTALYRGLPPQHCPNRLPLPRLPENRRPVPLPDAFAPTALALAGQRPMLHPMIDSNASTLWRYAFAKRLTGSEFYLHDHHVQGKPVLPGVAYLEMARFAGQSASPVDHVASLANVMWMTPMTVSEPLDVMVELLPQEEHVAFEIFSTPAAEQHIVHAQGEIHYAETPPPAPARVDVPAVLRRLTQHRDQATLYAQFERMGYGYGPSFVATQSLRFGADEALSELRVPADLVDTVGELALHPSLMDAALRTTLGLDERFQQGETPLVLPFSLGRVQIHRMLTPRCYAYATRAPGSTPSFPKFRVQLLNHDGEVLIDISDFAARQVRVQTTEAGYYQASWTLPAHDGEARPLGPGPVMLWSDDHALHEALRQQPQLRDRNMTVVRTGQSLRQLDEQLFELDPRQSDQVRALFAQLKQQGRLPSLVVHALALSCDAPGEQGRLPLAPRLATLERDLDLGLRSVLRLYQACHAVDPDLALRCLFVHPHGQAMWSPQNDMVAAFGKSLTSVSPNFVLGSLSLDDASMTNRHLAAQGIVQELATATFAAGTEARRVMGARLVRRILPYTDAGAEPLHLSQGAVVLVTGALGKLGRVFCRYLATRTQARLALLGRSPGGEEAEAFVQELQSLGAPKALYIAADSADPAAMRSAVRQACDRLGPIQGVLHCAGMVSTVPAAEASPETFDAVLQAKLHGTLVLDEVTRDQPLAYFILFSSLSSLVGDFGYGNYAAANRFLDGFALLRQQWAGQGDRPGETLSMGWPLWDEGGMDIPPQDRALYFNFSGMEALSTVQGLQAFEQMLKFRQGQLAVVHGDVERIHRVMQIRPEDGGRAGAPGSRESGASPCGSMDVHELPAAYTVTEVDESLTDAASALVRGILSETLEIPAAQLDDEQPFEAYGMDSVLIMKMSKRLQDKLGDLPKTTLFEYNAVATLAAFLVSDRAAALSAAVAPPQPSVPAGAAPTAAEAAPRVEPAVLVREGSAADGSRAVGERAARRWSQGRRPSLPAALRAPSSGVAVGDPHSAPMLQDDPIAIIGMAGRYPQSPDLATFWRHALDGTDVTGDIPAERWDAMRYFSAEDRARNGRSRSRWGGFLDGVEQFDAAFFRMTPEQAGRTDPQLRIALESAWHAVEDAGYTPASLGDRRIGVYMGVQYADHGWVAAESYLRTGHYAGPGCMHSELANQVSAFMDFRGPSLTVETGCSSAMTALHLARRAIEAGDCDCALAGAVNLSLHPSKYLMLDGLKVLSPQGVERPFDESADGYVPSEGVGTVLLKRYSQALRDGDQILGLLRGSHVNHAGQGAGQHLPNIRQLEACFDAALKDAGVSARQLQYIECHGTGTALGDPIELKALVNRLQVEQAPAGQCVVSTKGNFGHLEAASGMCSLTKVVLSLRHGLIPPCGHLATLNKAFDPATLPLRLSSQAQAWPADVTRRLAGINSFGLGGSNAFVIVESAPMIEREVADGSEPRLWVLSARSERLLRDQVRALYQLATAPDCERPLAQDAAFTLLQGRVAHAHRLALVAADWAALGQALAAWLDGHAPMGLVTGEVLGLPVGRSAWAPGPADALPREALLLQAAQAWVGGASLTWDSVCGAGEPRRASMPLTVFDRQPCLLEGRRLAEIQALGAPAVQCPDRAPAGQPADALAPGQDIGRGAWPTSGWAVDAEGPAPAAARKHWRLRYASPVDLKPSAELAEGTAAAMSDTARGAAATALSSHPVTLDVDLSEGLRRLAWQEGLSAEALVAAAWSLALARSTGVAHAALLVDTGRRCLFSVLHTNRRGSTVDWVRTLQTQLAADVAHAAPDEHTLSLWLPKAVRMPTALPALVLQAPDEAPRIPTRAGLSLCMALSPEGLSLCLVARPDRLFKPTLPAQADLLQLILRQMVAHPLRNPAAITTQSRQDHLVRFLARMDTADSPAR